MENRYGRYGREWDRSRGGGGYGSREGSAWGSSRGDMYRGDMPRGDMPRQEYGGERGPSWGYSERRDPDWSQGWRGSSSWRSGGYWNEPYHEERWPGREERWQSRDYDEGESTWDRMRENLKRTFSGKGPKGFVRTDARIHEDICELLTEHPEVDASEIEVSVNNGEVMLSGTVHERRQKRLAEDVADEVIGVRFVENRIRVQDYDTTSSETRSTTATTATAGTQTWKDTH
jgi:HSP20 family molecular chaperone IbpA